MTHAVKSLADSLAGMLSSAVVTSWCKMPGWQPSECARSLQLLSQASSCHCLGRDYDCAYRMSRRRGAHMWLNHGCSGLFSCGGRGVRCGQRQSSTGARPHTSSQTYCWRSHPPAAALFDRACRRSGALQLHSSVRAARTFERGMADPCGPGGGDPGLAALALCSQGQHLALLSVPHIRCDRGPSNGVDAGRGGAHEDKLPGET